MKQKNKCEYCGRVEELNGVKADREIYMLCEECQGTFIKLKGDLREAFLNYLEEYNSI